jgi:hypothetical protein
VVQSTSCIALNTCHYPCILQYFIWYHNLHLRPKISRNFRSVANVPSRLPVVPPVPPPNESHVLARRSGRLGTTHTHGRTLGPHEDYSIRAQSISINRIIPESQTNTWLHIFTFQKQYQPRHRRREHMRVRPLGRSRKERMSNIKVRQTNKPKKIPSCTCIHHKQTLSRVLPASCLQAVCSTALVPITTEKKARNQCPKTPPKSHRAHARPRTSTPI